MMDENSNPMGHPEEQPTGTDESPRFGRLLIVLALAELFIGAMTFIAVKLYT